MFLLYFPTNAWNVYTQFMLQWVLIVHMGRIKKELGEEIFLKT